MCASNVIVTSDHPAHPETGRGRKTGSSRSSLATECNISADIVNLTTHLVQEWLDLKALRALPQCTVCPAGRS